MKTECWYADNPTRYSTLEDIWQRIFPQERWQQLSLDERNLLTKASVGYILNVCHYNDMRRILRHTTITLAEIRLLRQVLIADFRAVLGIKLMLIRATARKMNGGAGKIRQEIRQANRQITRIYRAGENKHTALVQNDAALYRCLGRMGWRRPLQAAILEYKVEEIPSIGQTITACGELLAGLQVYVNRYVNRKLLFIVRSQNFDTHDLAAEIMLKAAGAFYYYTPNRDDEYRKNSVKRAIHNAGIELIQYWTKEDKSRLIKDKFTGEFRNVIEGNLRPTVLGRRNITQANAGFIAPEEFTSTENIMAIRDYVLAQPTSAKAAMVLRILDLLAMQQDENFVRFVADKEQMEVDSNEVIYEILGRRAYLALTAEYLGVPLRTVKDVVRDLRQSLSH